MNRLTALAVSTEPVKAFIDYRGYLYCPPHGRPFTPHARITAPLPIYARNSAHNGETCDFPGCPYVVPTAAHTVGSAA